MSPKKSQNEYRDHTNKQTQGLGFEEFIENMAQSHKALEL